MHFIDVIDYLSIKSYTLSMISLGFDFYFANIWQKNIYNESQNNTSPGLPRHGKPF